MAYCSGCGRALEEGSKFCSGCGMSATGTQTSVRGPAPVMQPTRVVVVLPKRGGWLAVKGLVTAFILAFILAVVLFAVHGNRSAFALCMILAYGSGVAYITINLRQWKRNNEVIKGAGIGWSVVALLLLFCLVTLTNEFGGGNEASTSVGSSTISSLAPAPDPKETLLRNVKLDFKWHKDGFGNVMIADFTLKNPTEYRFKDFEIKCTHSAPSGTVIDSNSRTIYETVGPKSTKVIKEMNMGFINSQASTSNCQITDLVPLQ